MSPKAAPRRGAVRRAPAAMVARPRAVAGSAGVRRRLASAELPEDGRRRVPAGGEVVPAVGDGPRAPARRHRSKAPLLRPL